MRKSQANARAIDYDKLRLKKIEYNATRMSAYGANNLGNKILEANRNLASRMRNDEMLEDDDDDDDDDDVEYESEDDEDQEGQCEISLIDKSHEKRTKLCQTLSIGDQLQQQQNRKKPLQNSQLSAKVIQVQSSKQEKQHQQKKGVQSQQQQNRKNPVKYCPPGSLDCYRNLQQRQKKLARTANNINFELDDNQEGGDVASEPDIVHEAESSRGGNHQEEGILTTLFSSEGNRMDNVNDAIDDHPSPMENENISKEPSDPVSEVKKHRGPTTMIEVHRRTLAERELVYFNKKGQPIEPDAKVVTRFSRFLGTIAKCPNLAPLNYITWKFVPAQKKTIIWEYVKKRYIIDEGGKKWVLRTVNDLWRVYKSRLKEKHFTPYETNEERLANKPENIPITQFTDLLDYWSSEVVKETSKKTKGVVIC